MVFPNPWTDDWSHLSRLLRFAQREGWTIAFKSERVLLAHRRAARGVVVLPASLLAYARGAGWRVVRRPAGFELRHAAVRQRVEVSVSVA